MHFYSIPPEEVIKFVLVLSRVGGIMTFTPLFGSLTISVQVKAALALAIAIVLYPPLAPSILLAKSDLFSLFFIIGGEFLIGALIGLVAKLLFSSLEMAGQMMSFQVGFSLINAIDPMTDVQSTVLSTSETLVGLLVFLGFNGHHWFIKAISQSFVSLAPTKVHFSTQLIGALIKLSSDIFIIGFQLAAPVLVVLIITDIIYAMLARAAPQVQIMIVGLPFKSWVGFFCLGISFNFFASFMERHILHMYQQITALLKLLT